MYALKEIPVKTFRCNLPQRNIKLDLSVLQEIEKNKKSHEQGLGQLYDLMFFLFPITFTTWPPTT